MLQPSGPVAGSTEHKPDGFALPVFFAHATRVAAYKQENDDATFAERRPDGLILAGLFDGVTLPGRSLRAGHIVGAFVRERLRTALSERDHEGRPPIIANVLARAVEDSVNVLDDLGGGAATTATVVVAAPMRTREWRLYVINAGNSRATAFLPDGTITPLTRPKPPGTSFAAINTLTAGFRYHREASTMTAPSGTTLLFTSDGIHDNIPDSRVWVTLGRTVESSLIEPSQASPVVPRLARAFVESIVEQAVRVQERAQRPDDATALAVVLGDPTPAFEPKRQRGANV